MHIHIRSAVPPITIQHNNITPTIQGKHLTGIGVSQQRTNGEQHIGDCESRTPILLQNVKTYLTVVVDIAVVNACSEHHLPNKTVFRHTHSSSNSTDHEIHSLIKIPVIQSPHFQIAITIQHKKSSFRTHKSPPKIQIQG